MNRGLVALAGALLLTLCIGNSTAWAEAQKVVAYLTKKVSVFEQKGKSFKRTARIPATEMPAIPVLILEVSPKGFVKIDTPNGMVWLDPMDIDIKPPKSSGSSLKKHQVSSSSTKKSFHTRGIGE